MGMFADIPIKPKKKPTGGMFADIPLPQPTTGGMSSNIPEVTQVASPPVSTPSAYEFGDLTGDYSGIDDAFAPTPPPSAKPAALPSKSDRIDMMSLTTPIPTDPQSIVAETPEPPKPPPGLYSPRALALNHGRFIDEQGYIGPPARDLPYEYTAGVGRGTAIVGSMGKSLIGMGADVVGAEKLGNKYARAAKALREVSGSPEWGANIGRIEDIGSPRDFIHWIAGGVGEQTPIMGAMVGSAVFGGPVGTVAAPIAMQTGSIYGDLAERGFRGKKAAAIAVGFGTLTGALDALPIMRVLNRGGYGKKAKDSIIKKLVKDGVIKTFFKEGSKQFAIEAGTEGLQTIGERAAIKWVDENYKIFDKEGLSDIANAMSMGGVIGFGGGGVSAPSQVSAARESVAQLEPPPPEVPAIALSQNAPEAPVSDVVEKPPQTTTQVTKAQPAEADKADVDAMRTEADKLGVTYNGPMEGADGGITHTFTDSTPGAETSFNAKTPGELAGKLAAAKARMVPTEGKTEADFEKMMAGENVTEQAGGEKFTVKPPKKLYRGVMKSGEGVGTFSLGKGLYSTPDKSFLAGRAYDEVNEVSPDDAFPRNPLVLNAQGDVQGAFSDWLLQESGEKNIRTFNAKYPDPAEFVRSKGYDGVIAGSEVVKYPDTTPTTPAPPVVAPTAVKPPSDSSGKAGEKDKDDKASNKTRAKEITDRLDQIASERSELHEKGEGDSPKMQELREERRRLEGEIVELNPLGLVSNTLIPGDKVTTDEDFIFVVDSIAPVGKKGDTLIEITWDDGKQEVKKGSELEVIMTPQPYTTPSGERKMSKAATIEPATKTTPTTPAPPVVAPTAVKPPSGGEGVVAVDKDDIEIEDINGNPVFANKDGTITLYHRTSQENAEKIKKSGQFTSKERGEVFFSTKEKGQAEGYGEGLVEIKIDPSKVSLDDAFADGEVHVSVNNKDISLDNIADVPSVQTVPESGKPAPVAKKPVVKKDVTTEKAKQPPPRKLTVKQQIKESIKGPEEPATITATEALKYALQHEAKGSVKGYRQGQLEITANNKEMADFIKGNLPLSERGRLIKAVTGIRSKADRYKVINAVNRIQENYDRRLAIQEFDKAKSGLDLKHVLPKYQKKVKALFDDISRTTTSAKLLRKMESLKLYLDVKTDPDVPDSLIRRMREVLAGRGKVPFAKMTPDEIRLLTNTMKNIVHQGKLRNALIGAKRERTYKAVKDESVDTLNKRHKEKYDITAGKYVRGKRQGKLARIATWDQTSMDTKVEILGGEKGTIRDVLYEDLQAGERKALIVADMANTKFQSIAGDIDQLKKLSPAFHSDPKKATKELLTTVELPTAKDEMGGRVKSIEILPAEKMDLYATWQDPSNRQKLTKDKQKGITLANSLGPAVKLFPDDVRAIIDSMSATEKKMADELVKFHNSEMQKEFDKAWVDEHGYSIVNPEVTHWPRVSDAEYRETDPVKTMQSFTKSQLDRMGIFRERKGGNDPLVIEDIFNKYSKYTIKVAAYIGKSAPSTNAMRLLKDRDFRNTVRAKFKYGDDLLADMEKVVRAYRGLDVIKNARFEKYVRSFLSKMHVGVLGLKPHIMMYQPVSYLMASTEIEWKYLTHTPKRAGNKQILIEINETSPQLKARLRAGGGEIITPHSAGMSLRHRWTGQDSWWERNKLNGIHKMDTLAIVNIWAAAKAEQQDLGYTGAKLTERTARRAEQIVNRTQPTWDVLTSSFLAVEAKDSLVAKMATLYSSQRSKNMNMMVIATSKYNHSKKTAKDKANYASKIFTISTLQSALVYLIRFGWIGLLTGRFFKDDDDRTWVDHVIGVAKQALGNWLVIGDAVSEAILTTERAITGRPYYGMRGNPLADSVEQLGRLLFYTTKTIKDAATGERYVGGKHAGRKKWPVDATNILHSLSAVGMLTGVPIGGAMLLGKLPIDAAKQAFIEEFGDKKSKPPTTGYITID